MRRRAFLRSIVGAAVAAVVPLPVYKLIGHITVYFPAKKLGVLGDTKPAEIDVQWVKVTTSANYFRTEWAGSKLIGRAT